MSTLQSCSGLSSIICAMIILASLQLRHQLSPALSAAAAVCGHVRDWLTGLPHDTDWVSMGVSSDGSYGIAAGLVYSFPVACGRGTWAIIKGVLLNMAGLGHGLVCDTRAQETTSLHIVSNWHV